MTNSHSGSTDAGAAPRNGQFSPPTEDFDISFVDRGRSSTIEQTPSGASLPMDDSALTVDDRLSKARQHRGDLLDGQSSLLREELRRLGVRARHLVAEGAELPAGEDARRLLGQMLGPLSALPNVDGLREWGDADVWKGLWYLIVYLAREQTATARRRLEGNYTVDDYGLDEGVLHVVMPLLRVLFQRYWRVELLGLENIPGEGRALLVSNHSGVVPFDGAMITTGIYSETPTQRLPRALVANWFPTVPFLSMLLQKTGQVQANALNAHRLLERDELVLVFPEGVKGIGKMYRDRYQLARFGRGGFIRVAVSTGAPIIPIAVVGAEETYPVIGRSSLLARILGLPYFPMTLTFPWLGPLGLVPLPTKWTIELGKPIHLPASGARAAANPLLVSRLSDHVRSTIQQMLLDQLAQRRSVFLG